MKAKKVSNRIQKSCKKSFATIYYFKNHIRTIHDEYKENKCDICDKKFPVPSPFQKAGYNISQEF